MSGFRVLSVLIVLWTASVDDATQGTRPPRGLQNFQHDNKIAGFFGRILEYSKNYRGSHVDLVFVLDSSSSVGGHNHFKSLKVFIQSLVSEFSVSPSTTRVGLVLCSTKPTLQFSLNQFVNKECTVKSMKQAKFAGGKQCLLGPSLRLTHRLILQSRRATSSRHQPKPVVIILSASPHDSNSRPALAFRKLRDVGAEVFLLAIGKLVPHVEYKLLFGKPYGSHYLVVNSPTELGIQSAEFIKNKGLNQACHTKGTVYDECRRRCQCSNGQMINCYRVRKEFTSMSLDERRLYIRTLKTVSTVQPYKRVYDEMTSYHPRWFDDVHQLKYFFPWHRWYILIFENFLRQIDCRVTVPYWDWSQALSYGRLWRTEYLHDIWYPGAHALGGNGEGEELCVQNGPFRQDAWTLSAFVNQSCLSREFNDCFADDLPNRTVTDSYLKMSYVEFQEFENSVREIMHDNFHNAVGGVMSYDESANAPEFWFHHAFLDKTWADWQSRGLKFKHQYFPSVKSNLPGTYFNGADFINLSRQPLCVRVEYDPISDLDFPDNKHDQTVKDAVPIFDCGEDEDYLEEGDGDVYDDDDDDDDDHNDNVEINTDGEDAAEDNNYNNN